MGIVGVDILQTSTLASQKIAMAIAAFINRKFKIATLTAGSTEKSQKNRGKIANRCVSKSQMPNCNAVFPVKQQRQIEGAQIFRNKKSLRFLGRGFKSQRFRVFKIAAFSGR